MDTDSIIEEKIIHELLQSGWRSEDLLIHQKISIEGRLTVVDIVLLYQLLPMAIVEVKSPANDLKTNTDQIWNYIEIADVPFAFLTNGQDILMINTHGKVSEINKFPSPKELWEGIGRDWDKRDPLLFPAAEKRNVKPHFHQAQAISQGIESLKRNKRVGITLPSGSGKSYVAFQIVWKTLRSNFYDRALIICDTVTGATQLSSLFSDFREDKVLVTSSEELYDLPISAQLVIATYQKVIGDTRIPVLEQDFDFVVLLGNLNGKLVDELSKHFTDSTMLIISNLAKLSSYSDGIKIAYQYSLEDAVLAEDVRIPDGYKSVQLEEIADIASGYFIRSKNDDENADEVLALTGRSLLDGGLVDFDEVKKIIVDKRRNPVRIKMHDILLAAISSNQIKVGYIGEGSNENLVISNSLILIRVNLSLANPKDVFDFLISQSGQLNLIRYTSSLSTSIRKISVSQLAKMPVLIPVIQDALSERKSLELSLSVQVKETIEKDILPLFDNLSPAEEDDPNQESRIQYIAEKLRSVALKLSPPKLKDKILSQYPMPIAMSYRRFLDSKFNAYEQILRLRDLFESASFFVYNVTLADLLRRLDGAKYKINEAGARRAYNGYSMSKRIDFLKEIFDTANQEGNKDDLFIPEILGADIISKLKDMGEFRNLISHTAAATENRQKKIVTKYRPIVEDILERLEFITSYRLVRIPEFKFTNGRLIRRMEIYAGVVPELEEFPIPNDNEFIKAESDHLVLLDQEDQFLDLFPFYQLFASKETYDETQMCFLKQRKAEQKILIGESVQGSKEVLLDGFDIFEDLQKKVV